MKKISVLAFSLTIALIALSRDIWAPKSIGLAFKAKSDQPFSMEISWDTAKALCFENPTITRKLKEGGGKAYRP